MSGVGDQGASAVGASAFHVCYGIRWEVDASDAATVQMLEQRRHPHQVAAKLHQFRVWWGATTIEGRYYVLVGRLIGHYGWEGEPAGRLTDAEAATIILETTDRLRAAGIEGQPAWHYQFESDQ